MKQPTDLIEKYYALQAEIEETEQRLEQIKAEKDAVFNEIGIPLDKEYTLRLNEYRDDRSSIFQVAQECKVKVNSFSLVNKNDKVFIHPNAVMLERAKVGKKPYQHYSKIYADWSLNWELIDETGNVVLSYRSEEFIIPDKYTDEQLKRIKELSLSVQRF